MARIAMFVRSVLLLLALAPGRVEAQLPPPLPPPGTPTLSKLDPLVQARLSNLTGRSLVIVRATSASSVGAVRLLIQQSGGTVGRQLSILDALAADVANTALSTLSNSPSVARIALDRRILGTTERTGATIGATAVRQALGYDGSGVGVAVIDSGVIAWHDDLTQGGLLGSQRVDQFVDFVNGRATPYDDYGHGTHVAGVIAGNGFDSGAARSGIAPGARLIALKVLDQAGRGRISNAIAALDYAVSHRYQYNIRIINLSVAAGVFESYNSDLLTLAAKRAVDQGIVVVASAGNRGKDSNGRRQYGAIASPGNAPWVLTVGASSHMGTINRADDTMAAFSSRGPTAIDRAAKPDLVAPGVGIESLSAPDSALFTSKSAYLLTGTIATPYRPYLSLSGTSQAAPVVAGTVALMLQANPTLTPNAVKAMLQYTAQEYPGYDALTQGAGFINARGAVELARFFAGSPNDPYPSVAGWSRQLIWGNHRVRSGRLTATANAWGTDVVWGAASIPGGQTPSWGVICMAADCSNAGNWTTWACSVPGCGNEESSNVVWGSACGGADCQGASWSTTDSATVWGTSESDEDTVVWGTTNTDEDTVVWGTSENEDVVWGCDNSSCSGGN